MSSPKRWHTAAELARICGVSERTVRNWVSQQNKTPCPRRKRGHRYYFELPHVRDWLAKHDKPEERARLQGYITSLNQPKQKSSPRADIEESIDRFEQARDDAETAAARRRDIGELMPAAVSQQSGQSSENCDIFIVRDTTARLYMEAVAMCITAAEHDKMAAQKNANAAADILRKLETDCITIAEKLKLVMLVSDVKALIGNLLSKVRFDLRSLPHALAADLAAASDQNDIRQMLTVRIDDALRHLAHALTQLDDGDQ